MKKEELVSQVAKDIGVSNGKAESAYKSLLQNISNELVSGGKITLPGFGTFSVKERKARNGRNPRTGEPLQIPAGKAVRFKASKRLMDIIE